MNYVYILECSDGNLYTGWTTDLKRRIDTHNSGRGSKCVRGRLPVKLIYFEEYETKSQAMKREAMIKKMSREEKLLLVDKGKEIYG